jgi:hypothetical protein
MIRVFYNSKPPLTSKEHYCLRKHKHDTQRDAVAAAKRMTKRYKKKYSVYHCYYCGHWHVGTDRTKTFKYLNRKGIWGKQEKKT